MLLKPQEIQKLNQKLAELYREHVLTSQFEDEFFSRHPKPKGLLWAGLVMLPLVPISLGLLAVYALKALKIRRALELERFIAASGQVLMTCPIHIAKPAVDSATKMVPTVVLGSFDADGSLGELMEVGDRIVREESPTAGSFQDQSRRKVSSNVAGDIAAYLFDVTVDSDDLDVLGRLLSGSGQSTLIPCIATMGDTGHIRQLPRSLVETTVVTQRPTATPPLSGRRDLSDSSDSGRSRWFQLGKVATSDGRFLIFDPGHYYPDPNPPEDSAAQLLFEGPPGPAVIAIKCLSSETMVQTVTSVRLLFSDSASTSQENAGVVTVDSGQMAVAPFRGLSDSWQVGGPRSRSAIVPSLRRIAHQSADPGDRMSPRARVATQAAQVLGDAGYELETGKRSYHFSHELTPEEITRCNAVLAGSGVKGVTAYNTMFGGGSDEELLLAAGFLEDAGFPVETSSIQYLFVDPLSDDDIGRANHVLRQSKVPASVSTSLHQTLAEISEQIDQTGFGRLPSRGRPFVVAFPSGWGHSSFKWYKLLDRGSLVGYRCDLITNG